MGTNSLGGRNGGVLRFSLGRVQLFPPRILNMTVPQVGQRPLIARRPFFITSSTASAISFFDLHLTQYPSGINCCCARPLLASSQSRQEVYEGAVREVNWENVPSQATRRQVFIYDRRLLDSRCIPTTSWAKTPRKSLPPNALGPELRPVWPAATLDLGRNFAFGRSSRLVGVS